MPNQDFGIDNEFSATPGIVPVKTQEVAKKFRREIDLKDGSGVQVFEGESMDELVDKLTEAQMNATRKIRELAANRRKPKVDKVSPTPILNFQPKQLSAVEQQQLADKQQTDPVGAFNDLFTAMVGATPQQFVANQAEQQKLLLARAQQEAEAEFLADHEDFEASPKAAKHMYALLTEQELPVTKNNLEYAYQELLDSGVLKPAVIKTDASQASVQSPEPQPIIKKPPTVLSQRASANAPEQQDTSGVDVAELSRLPLDQARDRIVSMLRTVQRQPA